MADKILLNNIPYHFNENDLPCLITYGEKVGGSHFTISMVADLFLQGSKILFLTAYSMAKDDFLQQVKGNESKIINATDENQLNIDYQTIILESGNEKLFWQAIKKIPDLQERIVLIKNVEKFSNEVLDYCLGLQKIIISGDIDKCNTKKKIIEKQFKTTIIFTKPKLELPFEIPVLEKYTGYLRDKNKNGYIKVQVEK